MMIEKAEEQRRADLGRRLDQNFGPALPGGARSRRLCAFSIITIAASTIAPIAIAMPPRLMMLELTQQMHAEVGGQYAERERNDGDQRAANVKQEHDADERDDQALFDRACA